MRLRTIVPVTCHHHQRQLAMPTILACLRIRIPRWSALPSRYAKAWPSRALAVGRRAVLVLTVAAVL